MHKAGFVNIVGNPNVGKSTLMNALVGERISIATFKAQTTRHRIMGIYNTDEMQIVFSDTPGVLKPNYKLQESMLNFSTSALTDADILLYVTDVVETPDKNNEFMEKVRQMTVPVLLLINKIDLTDQEKLVKLVEEKQISCLFIGHDLALVRSVSQRIAVMYLGRIVEILESETLAAKAVHPYTKMLLGSVFDVYCDQNEEIAAAKGEPPSPLEVQKGCAFAGRCNWCREKCKEELPLLQEIEPGHKVACFQFMK